ncbi:MAG: carbohydrate kinase family protein [Candidatus Aenigmarchaeota archaeon]|nr:carbohydrate kinase family protein [Candidatus Aenigmarchaeota archaeon]
MNVLTTRLYNIVGIGNPTLDILYTREGRKEFPGGATTNTIVMLQRFGLKTAMIGRVGEDEVGESLIKELDREGVDTTRIRREGSSARCYVTTTPEERETIRIEYYYPLEKLLKEDLNYIESSECVLLSAVDPLFRSITSISSEYSIKLFTKLQGIEQTNTQELLQSATIDTIFGNEKEVGRIERILESLLKKETKILLTQGKKGCKLYTNFGVKEYPGYQVESVDPTGAGDAFAAGFIYGMVKGWNLDKSCDFANHVGALATTYYGARSKKLTLEEIWSLR